MKILIIGNGGREDAIGWKLSQSPNVDEIFVAPGNGGTKRFGKNIAVKKKDLFSLSSFVKEQKIDLTIVGPETPLASGIVNHWNEKNLMIFGPSKEAAQLETSKVFAKEFMRKNNIPTAKFKVFSKAEEALKYIFKKKYPIVIKADGLCFGKGTFVCEDQREGTTAIGKIMEDRIFNSAGDKVIIEDFIEGEEASYIAFIEGENFLSLPISQDHKRIFDGDSGPNTGGMGAYSPTSLITQDLEEKIKKDILIPTISGLHNLGIVFKGILYLGLIFKDNNPYLLEYNTRFGDPETQAIIPRLSSDLLIPIMATIEGGLNKVKLEVDKRKSLCVVLASLGYPENYEKHKEIKGVSQINDNDIFVFYAGVEDRKGKLLTSGGRVLGITGLGNTIKSAKTKVYNAISNVTYENIYFRSDIGNREIEREEGIRI
ncbi:MAG: phosphoribosylamine--glycine ligase [bacterium]